MRVLALENVGVQLDRQWILQDISVEIEKSEIFVIVGPSGEGKTTLLKTLSGLVTPQKGKTFCEQGDWLMLSKKDQDRLLRRRGVLFQKNALFDSFTCLENICFPLRETTSLSESDIQTKALHFLDAVGILHAKDLYPDEISGGMQKRLGIARALALEPEVIFYDDPTAGLDPITSKKIIELIIQLQKEKESTVVAVTNDMNRAFQMADRIGFVFKGRLIISGSPSETKAHPDPRIQQFIHGRHEGPLTPHNDSALT